MDGSCLHFECVGVASDIIYYSHVQSDRTTLILNYNATKQTLLSPPHSAISNVKLDDQYSIYSTKILHVLAVWNNLAQTILLNLWTGIEYINHLTSYIQSAIYIYDMIHKPHQSIFSMQCNCEENWKKKLL